MHRHVAAAPARLAGAAWRGEALPGDPHGSAPLRKRAALGPPSLHSSSHFVWSGAPSLWACPHLPQYQSSCGWQQEQHAGLHGPSVLAPAPPARWLCVTASRIPVTFSASCHHLSSFSLAPPPSPVPEGLEKVSTGEKFHTFNLFIRHSAVYLRCLCVTVKSYLYHLHRISYLPGVL